MAMPLLGSIDWHAVKDQYKNRVGICRTLQDLHRQQKVRDFGQIFLNFMVDRVKVPRPRPKALAVSPCNK
jgi:hypothetical protein